jgi:hypothetical protein
MKTLADERGALNVLLIPVILLSLLFVGAAAFAVWAYGGRQDYKNNVDAKIDQAVAANKKVVQAADAKQYAEAAKQPLKTYTGPEQYGSVALSYPKTWSGYVATASSGNVIDGYFTPGVVPDVQDTDSTYALRVRILSQSYSQTLQQFNPYVKQNKLTMTAYSLPKLPQVGGMYLSGQIAQQQKGTMVILPLRDKTLEVWTESDAYLNDFKNYVLPNLTFSP